MASLSTDGKEKSAEKLKDALYGANSGGKLIIADASISEQIVDSGDANAISSISPITFSLNSNQLVLSSSKQFTISAGDKVFYYYLTNYTTDEVYVHSQITSSGTTYTLGGTFSIDSLVITVN